MKTPFKLYGAELSPYSVKVRSYLRFKGLQFEWLLRSGARQEEFARYAKLPLIPVLVDADDIAHQDSTPIIEALEAEYPEPSITPDDPALAFLSALLEDYADEWLNKAMFHYRWSYPEDQAHAASRIADMIFDGAEKPDGVEEGIRTRMIGRLYHVGSSPETAPIIESSFKRAAAAVEALLSDKPYVFGARPALADFGLSGQFAQLLSDPTPAAFLRSETPRLIAWVQRMEQPRVEGPFERFDALKAGLEPLLRDEVARVYLPWMEANAHAVADDATHVSVALDGSVFAQKPQRYAAKALAELRRKRALVADEGLTRLLDDTGCGAFLAASSDHDEDEDDGTEIAADAADAEPAEAQ